MGALVSPWESVSTGSGISAASSEPQHDKTSGNQGESASVIHRFRRISNNIPICFLFYAYRYLYAYFVRFVKLGLLFFSGGNQLSHLVGHGICADVIV